MLQSMGSQRVGHNWETEQQLPTSNLLTLSPSCCLENLPTLDTAVCGQLAGSTSGYPLVSVAAVKRKKNRNEVFFFPFPENKEDKKNSEPA